MSEVTPERSPVEKPAYTVSILVESPSVNYTREKHSGLAQSTT